MTSSSSARKSDACAERGKTEADKFARVGASDLSAEQNSDLLERRLGRLHARLRLGMEADRQAQNFRWSHVVLWACLHASGLHVRGRKNAAQIQVRHNYIKSARIPKAFNGYIILQLSDLHVEMSQGAMARLEMILQELDYDLCALTGDYQADSLECYHATLAGMSGICKKLKQPIYGVLGNYDTVRMIPELEQMGIRMLLNEYEMIERDQDRIYIAGIDDAHFYRTHNIEKAASGIPANAFSILFSHTPEIYQQAAHADFDVLLSGHTHGGQICLPGGIPITLDSVLPRHMGSGAWTYRGMNGYTSAGVGCSIVPARFNCPPQITLHVLQSTESTETHPRLAGL
jgi:uncharacterized protein